MARKRWTIPSVQEYKTALLEADLSSSDRKMLASHYAAAERTLSAWDMADIMGFANYNAANLRYGGLGGKLCRELGVSPAFKVEVLCSFVKPQAQGNAYWLWVLRPPVIEALEELGWVVNPH